MSEAKPYPEGNVCLFSHEDQQEEALYTYQFVYETLPGSLRFPRNRPNYSCHLVTEGSALLQTDAGSFPLAAGDLFFTFPACAFSLTDIRRCKYLYISFTDGHKDSLLSSCGITREKPMRQGFGELIDFWFGGLGKCTPANLPMLTRGILCYTLSLIPAARPAEQEDSSVITQIRSAVEQCCGNADFSLAYICRLYSYHPKYISRRFREVVGVSFSDYLQNCRLQRACSLLTGTDAAIQDIAASVGYRDAAYFSRVFRRFTGISPSEYRSLNGSPGRSSRNP